MTSVSLRRRHAPWMLLAAVGLSLACALMLTRALPRVGGSAPAAALTSHGTVAAPPALSAASLAEISAQIGAREDGYDFGTRAALRAPGSLAVSADRHGVLVHAGAGVQLSLRALGRPGDLQRVGAGAPIVGANRALFASGAVSEWYVNGPLGLEQGFDVAAPPRGDGSAGTLELDVHAAGATSIALQRGGSALIGARGVHLQYGSLAAADASGRVLRTSLAARGGELLLRVDTRNARYPIRIDPLVTEAPEAALLASGETEGGELGMSVAVSGDGSTVLAGAPGDENSEGAVWVFAHRAGSWVMQAGPLVATETVEGGELCAASGEEDCHLGRSTALSYDGDVAIVGAPAELGREGAALLFTRSGETWSRTATISSPSPGALAYFGRSVALSSDGDEALIGAPGAHFGRGGGYVFADDGGIWASQGPELEPEGLIGEAHVGGSVALSGDGTEALLGGPGQSSYTGGAWIFSSRGGDWAQVGPMLSGSGVSEKAHLGSSVALSEDGSTALIAARADSDGAGAAWVFTGAGSSWSQQSEKLVGIGESDEQFGNSVALSGDGSLALIGSARGGHISGGAWLLTRSGTSWSGARETFDGEGAQPQLRAFGASVALSSAGTTAVIGAPGDDARAGAAWVFGTTAPTPGGELPAPGSPTGVVLVDIASKGSGGVLSYGSAHLAGCRVRVLGKRISVGARRRARLTLQGSGTGWCGGSLRIAVRGRGTHSTTIAAGHFNLLAGHSRVVALALTRAGLAMFRARHWSLGVNLTIIAVRPQASIQTVREHLARPGK